MNRGLESLDRIGGKTQPCRPSWGVLEMGFIRDAKKARYNKDRTGNSPLGTVPLISPGFFVPLPSLLPQGERR